MNGIVTGKVEKIAGSMVFKSVRSLVVANYSTVMGLYYKDITNPYVKFVNIKGEINIMSIPMIEFYNSGSYSTDMKSNSGRFYEDFYIYRNNDEDSVYIRLAQSGEVLSSYFSSFEVGTLEIT
ncbi:MAG TPA: hypothetical protein DCW90_08595 [Lachnospiraceae bacterium]|nr:hypothetical protein [Lachnospiraceae bacterium]